MNTYECDNCGLCCSQLYVEATIEDVMREPRINDAKPMSETITHPIEHAAWVISPCKPCLFLADSKCSIYATRPHCCVMFPAGPGRCHELRERAGLAPLQPKQITTAVERLAARYYEEIEEV